MIVTHTLCSYFKSILAIFHHRNESSPIVSIYEQKYP